VRDELAFVGDVHLDRDDPALPAFLDFLDRLEERAARIVFVGDLFNLWLGDRRLELPHQRQVLERVGRLRRSGIVVRYVEGNRDFHLARAYAGSLLDEVSSQSIAETWGGLRIFAAHGDLVNVEDRPYRAWRRFARSRLSWIVFRSLPASRRLGLAHWLERRLRTTNLEHKSSFPEEAIRRYARAPLGRGFDAVVLGHFHVERELREGPPPRPGRIFVLPCWRETRRHLRVGGDGTLAFSGPA
jgi:UDP-2,3-diacylglucosamine hydrolase